MSRPLLVLVTGPAGTGKTTLAARLGPDVGCPVVSRDAIKEGMVVTRPDFVPDPTDPLTLRTYDVFFSVLQLLVEAEVSVVAEAAFQHELWGRGLRPLQGSADLRVVRCHATDARDRAARRLVEQPGRRAHADSAHLAAADVFLPLTLDVPTLDVDTRDGYDPAYADVLAFCRSQP